MSEPSGQVGRPVTDAPSGATTVTVPAWYLPAFTVVGAVLGAVVAFIVGPVVSWLVGLLGDAPGPLRLLAELPLAWALPVLIAVGAIAGFLICATWREDAGALEVSAWGITVHRKTSDRFLSRERLTQVVASKKELVVLDGAAEVYRGSVEDEMVAGLRAALAAHGYPPLADADPFEDVFSTWTEGDGRQDAQVEDLLRARRRALTDKKDGEVEAATEGLRAVGVVVRDRRGRQQYRLV